MKKSILEYMLKHPEQQEKFDLHISFKKIKDYGEEKINRISEGYDNWKTNFKHNKEIMKKTYLIFGEDLNKVLKYYEENIGKSTYLKIPENEWDTLPIKLFVDKQKYKLEEQNKLITQDWRSFIEEIIRQDKSNFDNFICYRANEISN